MKTAAVLALGVVLGLMAVGEARAGAELTSGLNSSATLNSGAMLIGGTAGFDQFNQAHPFVVQLFALGGECRRLQVIQEDTDLKAILVGPDGTIWVNDDATGSDNRPVIKAITQPHVIGWYTLQLARYTGRDPASNFYMYYGRFPSNNANCANFTPPLPSTAVALAAKH